MEPAAASPSDEDLACRLPGDQAAFRTLYDRYARRVFGLLATLGLSPDRADDVGQKTWMNVWKSAATKPAATPFCPWLMQVARHAAIDELRKRKSTAVPEEMQIAAEGHFDVLADVEETAEMQRFRECLAKLPALEKRIVQNRLEGIDSPAIGVELSMPSERVHRLFHEAKQKLQRCLGTQRT